MLICAVASLTLIAAGALVMDWYVLTLDGLTEKVAIDLRSVHACVDHVCMTKPLALLSGMFPTLSAVTLWSSLGFAVLVAFQAGARILTGTAYDSFTKLGYMLSLMAISLAVATAYMFGPEPQSVTIAIASRIDLSLQRTWAPLTLIVGLIAGFAAIYLAVAADSSDLGATYKPVTVNPDAALHGRARPPTVPPAIARQQTGISRTAGAPRDQAGPGRAHPTTEPSRREQTGLRAAPSSSEPPREQTGLLRSRPATDPSLTHTQPGIGPAAGVRPRSGPLPPAPEHLRNRLQYVALTAELTGGGIDARREDGLSRLVLWRDVVGVVVRRMPPAYDGAAFVDIVSTAGSTLRIVPWTRLSGEPLDGDGDDRPRAVVEHVLARCPDIIDSGEPAQLPDLDTLRAHDDRLA
ncbi:MAG: hypothetical protein E6J91_26845 [Deltaproteobacteria bacterium]|nr:MAG: hypothetical protein E6J91_26845 [Deltaproteobacteria bacterium]